MAYGARLSKQTINSLHLVLHEPADMLSTMQSSQKHQLMQHIKGKIKTWVRRLAAPTEYIDRLPASPAELQRDHPSMYAAAFPSSAPVPCQIDLKLVVAVDVGYRCRGSDGQLSSSASAGQLVNGSFNMQGVAQFANTMMGSIAQMQQQQQQQQQFMQMMFSQSSGLGGRPLQSLAALGSSAGQLRMTFPSNKALQDYHSHLNVAQSDKYQTNTYTLLHPRHWLLLSMPWKHLLHLLWLPLRLSGCRMLLQMRS